MTNFVLSETQNLNAINHSINHARLSAVCTFRCCVCKGKSVRIANLLSCARRGPVSRDHETLGQSMSCNCPENPCHLSGPRTHSVVLWTYGRPR